MAKIDFKTTTEKKNEIKMRAQEKGVSISYIMNQLVDDYLSGLKSINQKKEIGLHLTNLLEASRYLKNEENKDFIMQELEGLLCQML